MNLNRFILYACLNKSSNKEKYSKSHENSSNHSAYYSSLLDTASIEIIKIVYRICSTKFDIFHFLHIDVKDLCDVYTGKAVTDGVSVAISGTNEISATLTGKAVAESNLADDLANKITGLLFYSFVI